jgi:hypothetical protein
MPDCRSSAGPLAVLIATLAITLLATGVASAGFLDELFRGNTRQPEPASPAALPYATAPATASLAQPNGIAQPPIAPGAGYDIGYGTTYCVRLCDGRFFPLQGQASASPIQMCSAFCPAAKTRIFNGSEIADARAADGARYADLDNAFVYRQKIVQGCTCNGRDAFGLAKIELANDPTLQAGDIVATAKGLQRFTGSQAQLKKGGGFTPVPRGELGGQRPRAAATTVVSVR